ncbi:MAG: Heme-based aerotactic transducer HemAT [Proteobacteria bacterium]|nr:MAG: Heme-based aerotactic transducer HemAT [Pseudomonadota bacterium]|tara:strand:- start:331 stop:1398 length:1068 start_codon:yes stop_codon:yes gene_type:complete
MTDKQLLNFYQLEGQSFKSLYDFLVDTKILDVIMDDFYEYIVKFNALNKVIKRSNNQVENIKQAQRKHWVLVLQSGFDDHYFDRVNRIGMAHAKIQLTPEWYVGGYNRVQQTLLKKVTLLKSEKPKSWFNTEKSKYSNQQIDAFVSQFFKITNLDMAFSINSYVEMSKKETEEVLMIKQRLTEGIEESTMATSEIGNSISTLVQENDNCQNLISDSQNELLRLKEEFSSFEEDLKEVRSILSLITNVSEKTNLLSLNASIEAARAGDAGKGFAVVADEVKKLAMQTSQSAKDISKTLEKIHQGSDLINQSVVKVNDLTSNIISSTTVVNNMISAQSIAVDQVTETMESLNRLSER